MAAGRDGKVLIQELSFLFLRHPAGLRFNHLVELDFDAGLGLSQSDSWLQAADCLQPFGFAEWARLL